MTAHPVIVVRRGYHERAHQLLQRRLPMWVVYRPFTREYPGRWVARMHVILPKPKPTRFVMTHDTLQELRDMLPPGLTLFVRLPHDVPEIEEAWV